MAVPSTIDDVSATFGDNSPSGSEAILPNLDDYLRRHAQFIAILRDAQTLSVSSYSGYDPTGAADNAATFTAAGADGDAYIPPGTYKLLTVPTGRFWHTGDVTFTDSIPSIFFGLQGNTDGKLRSSLSTDRYELSLYADGDAYDVGSKGAGIHLYGNRDTQHSGGFVVMTGQDDGGDARMIITGGSSDVASGGYRTNTDTRVTIGNDIWDWTDTVQDTALLNLKNPQGRPAIYFYECNSTTEGELAVPTGESMSMGHWSGTAYTPQLTMDGSGRWIVGHTASVTGDNGNTPSLQVHGTSQSTAGMGVFSWNSSATSDGRFSFQQSAGGAIGTRGIVAADSELGTIVWAGDDGVGFIRAAAITCVVDATPGVDDMPGRIVFSTTPNGAALPVDRLYITNAGMVRPAADNTYSLGSPSLRFASAYATNVRPGDGTVIWTSGAGTPEGSVTANPGSLYTRTDGGASTSLYVKTSGTGNTGWTAK